MTDRELLEQAAKAAGMEGEYLPLGIRTYEPPHWSEDLGEFWNPLTDDGDALRLAVKLNIVIWECAQYNCALVEVRYGNASGELTEPIVDNDPYAATRRAIVRAAAEIGKDMK